MLPPKLFDHTILKPEATKEAVKKVCMEAVKYGFASVCVNEYYTAFAAKLLEGSGVKVCTVVGFPLGMTSTAVKCFEAGCAVKGEPGRLTWSLMWERLRMAAMTM